MITDYLSKWQVKGRIYTEYNHMRATDGRMSSREPNAQQIPRALKKIFYKPSKGKIIFKADYPAIEARLMGVIANDSKIIEIFKNKKDMHSETAASFLKKPVADVTEEERRKAKAANFGFMFGMGAKTYTKYAYTNYGLIVSIDEAFETRKKYMEQYSGVQRFHNRNSALLRDNYEVIIRTLLGRRMKTDLFTNANNYPVQGSAVDMIKLAVNLFYYRAKKFKYDAQIINIIHDELVVECSLKDKALVKKLLKESMEIAADFIIEIFSTTVEVDEVKN
jgi:DNA polymerase-1